MPKGEGLQLLLQGTAVAPALHVVAGFINHLKAKLNWKMAEEHAISLGHFITATATSCRNFTNLFKIFATLCRLFFWEIKFLIGIFYFAGALFFIIVVFAFVKVFC